MKMRVRKVDDVVDKGNCWFLHVFGIVQGIINFSYLVTIMHLWRARTVRVTIDWIPKLQNNPICSL